MDPDIVDNDPPVLTPQELARRRNNHVGVTPPSPNTIGRVGENLEPPTRIQGLGKN